VILLDTDICIALLRGNRRVIERRQQSSRPVAIAAMTAAELFYGAEKSSRPVENRLLVEEFLLTVPTLHTTLPVVREFGRLKASLERTGQRLADADLLIGATALCLCDRLVTGNTRHYDRIPGLRLVDWLR
jgi:tRNA(fMet)-specific endonuclease VapC